MLWDFCPWMGDSPEKFSRKFFKTVGLLVSECGTFAQNFLENFSLASPKNSIKLSYIEKNGKKWL
jgi:hypothetical protein